MTSRQFEITWNSIRIIVYLCNNRIFGIHQGMAIEGRKQLIKTDKL